MPCTAMKYKPEQNSRNCAVPQDPAPNLLNEVLQDFDVTVEYDEPIAQLAATILATATKLRASDIHFKVEKESFYYCYRIDGDLGDKVEMPMKLKDYLKRPGAGGHRQ